MIAHSLPWNVLDGCEPATTLPRAHSSCKALAIVWRDEGPEAHVLVGWIVSRSCVFGPNTMLQLPNVPVFVPRMTSFKSPTVEGPERPGLDLSFGRSRGGKAKFPENSGSLPLSQVFQCLKGESALRWPGAGRDWYKS